MRHSPCLHRVAVLPVILTALAWTLPASADIPPRRPGGDCKCATPGRPGQGSLPLTLLAVGALVLGARRRRP